MKSELVVKRQPLTILPALSNLLSMWEMIRSRPCCCSNYYQITSSGLEASVRGAARLHCLQLGQMPQVMHLVGLHAAVHIEGQTRQIPMQINVMNQKVETKCQQHLQALDVYPLPIVNFTLHSLPSIQHCPRIVARVNVELRIQSHQGRLKWWLIRAHSPCERLAQKSLSTELVSQHHQSCHKRGIQMQV